jgi:hypothetical protein
MENGERSGSGGRSDWPVRLATGVGTVAGASAALLLRPEFGESWEFWPGLIGFVVFCAVGAVLGRLVGGLLFRPPSGGPPEHPPHA